MNRLLVCMVAMGVSGAVMAQAPSQDAAGAGALVPAMPASGADAPSAVSGTVQKDPETAVRDIQRALRASDEVPADAISVVVHAQTVVLSGEVDSELEAARALSLAQSHSGDVRVSSHVEVRSPPAAQAAAVTSPLVREVERALKADRRTADLGISVSIDDQQVIGLHGLVPTRESRAAAEEVAARVDGVQSVSSRLVVPGE